MQVRPASARAPFSLTTQDYELGKTSASVAILGDGFLNADTPQVRLLQQQKQQHS